MIYGKFAQTNGLMSPEDLLRFLLTEQKENVTMEDAVELIQKYEVDPSGRLPAVSFDYAVEIMFSNNNSNNRLHL